jgi:hypothetical protein
MKGDDRAKELCVSRIRSEFDRLVSHSCLCCSLGSTHLWREVASELLELFQLLADIYLLFSVQQKRNYRLCSTGILYGLRREEEGIRRLIIVGAVFRYVAGFLAGGVLEKEYYAV